MNELPGNHWREFALEGAVTTLTGSDPITDLYKASLVGGHVGSRLLLDIDGQARGMWGLGSAEQAARLLGVWASTVATILLSHAPDQRAMRAGVAEGFAALMGGERAEIRAELEHFQQARDLDEQAMASASSPPPLLKRMFRKPRPDRKFIADQGAWLVMYLRSLRALDETLPAFSTIPMPVTGLEDLYAHVDLSRADLIDMRTFATRTELSAMLHESLRLAQSTYRELRESRPTGT